VTPDIIDGIWFGLGVFAVWLLAVLGASLIRGLGSAGGNGLVFAGKYVLGWHQFGRGDQSHIVNVTLNTTRGGRLSIDTIVADRLLTDVYQNIYQVMRLRAARALCTDTDPVICFPAGRTSRNEYRAMYDPIVNLVAERCTNSNSIDLALGRPLYEHHFVVAMTFERTCNARSQHFRAMMVSEAELLRFPDSLPSFEREEHRARFATLRAVARQYAAHPERFGVIKVWRHYATAEGETWLQ
jgi:hypothetical protein